MNTVIFGAGTVGTSIAGLLCANGHSVSLVDASPKALQSVEEQLDVRTIRGSACDSITLFQAGVQSADLVLAVTSTDEINLVGSSLARAMGARRSVARAFNPAYLDSSTFDYQRHFGIDRLLSLERLTALELARAIRMPSLFAVENFARGGIEVQELAVQKGSRGVGVPLKDLQLPQEVRIGLISGTDRCVIAGADDVIDVGDHVTLIGTQEVIEKTRHDFFEARHPPKQNVIIAGGGEIGFNLASLLQKGRFNVILMEADTDRCQFLAERLHETTVLHADATRQAEMHEARVGKADIPWLARFPVKCCNFAANLLVLELSEIGVGRLRRMMGTVRDGKGNDLETHVWVQADDFVADITADQFGQARVVVEQQSRWHDGLHDKKPFLPRQDVVEGISDTEIGRLRGLYEQVLGELAPFRPDSD